MARGDFVSIHPVYRVTSALSNLSNLYANFYARHSQNSGPPKNSGPGTKGTPWTPLSTALGGSKVADRKKAWVTDVVIQTRRLNQGRIKRSRGPGQLTMMSNFCLKSGEEQNKGYHIRRCPIFRPKSDEEQKKVITSAGRKIFQTVSGSLKCASGSLSDPRVSGSPSLSYCLIFKCVRNYIRY